MNTESFNSPNPEVIKIYSENIHASSSPSEKIYSEAAAHHYSLPPTPLEEQVQALKSIAESAEAQARTAMETVKIQEKQLRMAQKDATDAKHEALYSKVMSFVSIAIALAALINEIF